MKGSHCTSKALAAQSPPSFQVHPGAGPDQTLVVGLLALMVQGLTGKILILMMGIKKTNMGNQTINNNSYFLHLKVSL